MHSNSANDRQTVVGFRQICEQIPRATAIAAKHLAMSIEEFNRALNLGMLTQQQISEALKNERPEPQTGQIWRHYKGAEVSIMFLDSCQAKIAKDRLFERAIAACSIPAGAEVVFYECFGKAWVRSLENFLQILGDTHDPVGGTMFYRFERIK